MAPTEIESGSITLSSSEQTLNATSPTLTDAVTVLVLDLSNMVAGDVVEARAYEKVQNTSDTQREIDDDTWSHAQAPANTQFGPHAMLFGWKYTLKQPTGTGRVVHWSIRAA